MCEKTGKSHFMDLAHYVRGLRMSLVPQAEQRALLQAYFMDHRQDFDQVCMEYWEERLRQIAQEERARR